MKTKVTFKLCSQHDVTASTQNYSHRLKRKKLFIAGLTRIAITRRSAWNHLEICYSDSHGFSTSSKLHCSKVACLQGREFVTLYQTDNKSKTCCVSNTSKVWVSTSRTRTAPLRSCVRLKPTQPGLGLVHSRRARGDTSTHFSLTAAVRVSAHRPEGLPYSVWIPRSRCHGSWGFCSWVSERTGGSTWITWQYLRPRRRRERARVLSFPVGHERREGGEKENETAGVIVTPHCRQGGLRSNHFENTSLAQS